MTDRMQLLENLTTSLYALPNLSAYYNFSFSQPDTSRDWHDNIFEWVSWLSAPLLVICGTLGNLLGAAVLLRRRFRSISTSIFLLALAVSDTIFLFFCNFTLLWLSNLTGFNPRVQSDWNCRIIVYVFRSVSDISSWLVVAVTLERLLAVWVPFQAKALCSRPRALIAVVFTVATFLMVNSFTFVTYKVHQTYNNRTHKLCYVDEALGAPITLAIILYDDMCYSFAPACIICISNTAILTRMANQARRTRRSRNDSSGSRSKNSSYHNEPVRLTVMLVTVSVVFVICTLPICIVSSYYAITKYNNRPPTTLNPYLSFILRIMMNCNHAFNFLLYCLSGPPFRKELFKMMRDAICMVLPSRTTREATAGHEMLEQNGDTLPMMERTNEVPL